MSTKYLVPIDARLDRAERQVTDLVESLRDWGKNSKIVGVSELLPHRLGYEVRINGLDQSSIDGFGLPAGDCLHNLRSTLDNLAFALACLKADPPAKPQSIYFPIAITETKFSEARGFLRQIPEEVANALRSIQPFQRSGRTIGGIYEGTPQDDPLMLLHRVNISDKHRIPLAASIIPTQLDLTASVEFETEEGAAENVPPNVEIMVPLRENEVFMRWRTTQPLAKAGGTFLIQARINMIADNQLFELESNLVSFSRHVRLVVEHFRHFF